MTKPGDPHGQQTVNKKNQEEVIWYQDWRWMTAILILLLLGVLFLWPWNNEKSDEVAEVVATPEMKRIDRTPVILLKPIPKYCDPVSSSIFCSSNTEMIRILEAGDLLLLNPGMTRICAKKPVASITYKVVQNDKLRFTSALDLENPRCDIFVVTPVPR